MNSIAETARVSALADLEVSTRGSLIIIGENCMVDSFVKMKFSGGVANIVFGRNCYVNSGTVIYNGNGVTVGDNVLIAANCTLAPVNHEFRSKDKTIYEQRFMPSKGGIVIEDDVWIGANCVILDGTIIRKGAVIGACSLVKGEIPEYTVNAGNPLQQVGERK